MDATVLLVMDIQRGIVGRFADDAGYLPRLGHAITAARSAGIPVIYVTVGFRPGHPEISARNRSFSAIASAGRFTAADPAAGIHPAVAPAAEDPVVTKRRVSSFAGSDLEVLLRGLGAGTLVLAGIAGEALDDPPLDIHHQQRGRLHGAPFTRAVRRSGRGC